MGSCLLSLPDNKQQPWYYTIYSVTGFAQNFTRTLEACSPNRNWGNLYSLIGKSLLENCVLHNEGACKASQKEMRYTSGDCCVGRWGLIQEPQKLLVRSIASTDTTQRVSDLLIPQHQCMIEMDSSSQKGIWPTYRKRNASSTCKMVH